MFGTRGHAITSVAVLPFEDRSGNTDSEYLSDGLAESLIYQLSQLPNLKVSPTSSVMRYKGKPIDVQKIGRSDIRTGAILPSRMQVLMRRIRFLRGSKKLTWNAVTSSECCALRWY